MENDENLIACCGLYCGDCFNYKGEIADLARDLRKKLRENKFDMVSQVFSNMFKEYKDYPQCYALLGTMTKMRCKKGCQGGGANPGCKIRLCCRQKNIKGCWECSEFETCGKLDFLKAMHGDANAKNLRKLKKDGTKAFLEGKKYYFKSTR
jgi:hypothetical protein